MQTITPQPSLYTTDPQNFTVGSIGNLVTELSESYLLNLTVVVHGGILQPGSKNRTNSEINKDWQSVDRKSMQDWDQTSEEDVP